MEVLNRYFLQYMMSNGVIKCEDANDVIKNIAEKLEHTAKDFNTLVFEINAKILKQSLKLELKICEITGEKYCVLINKCIDDLSKSCSNHTPAELELFSNILTSIMSADSKCIPSISCLNSTTRMKSNISKDIAQDKIDAWTNNGYLVKKDGYIYLGPRTISEFEMYLKSSFPSRITTCKLCTDFVYYGRVCAECNEILHIHCSSKYIDKTSKCPVCKKAWREAEAKIYNDDDGDDDQEADESMDTD